MNIIQKIKLNNPEKENLQKTLYEIDTLSKRWTGIQKSGESDSEATKEYRNDYCGFALPRKHTLHGFANPKDNSETKSYQ